MGEERPMENSNLDSWEVIFSKIPQQITPCDFLLTDKSNALPVWEIKAPPTPSYIEEVYIWPGKAQRRIIRQRAILNYLHVPLHIEHVSLSHH